MADPPGCVPSHKTLFIPNVTTDVGLSPPYNSLFTFFGQFFDHGVDQTVKSGGTVFVPLRADDPLVTLGPDGKAGTGDEVPASQRFMVLTRAQNQPGPDGVSGPRGDDRGVGACTSLNVPAGCDESADDVQNANNTDSPWVDQSQTYTSHAAHQVFLREYELNAAQHPVSTGKLLGGLAASARRTSNSPDGRDGIGNWKATKLQAADEARTAPGRPGRDQHPDDRDRPVRQLHSRPGSRSAPVRDRDRSRRGQSRRPVPVPANVRYFDTPFLTDIAHNADPSPQGTDNTATPPVRRRRMPTTRRRRISPRQPAVHLRRRDAERALRLR